jgi:1,4-alpha-glucan branching enzyme
MLQKQYLKKNNRCKVTFTLPQIISAETACVVGDFNNWSADATAMTRQKNGIFTATLELEKEREYQFRYLVNNTEWHNDGNADKYVANPFNEDNCVAVI